MTSQPVMTTFSGRLGPFGDKNTFKKKERAQMLFRFLRVPLGSLLHYGVFYQMYFPYFPSMNKWLTVNLNYYELITSIHARLGIKDFSA